MFLLGIISDCKCQTAADDSVWKEESKSLNKKNEWEE